MRILLYAPNYLPAIRYGGPVRSAHGLARGLVGFGHEVHVFTTNVDGPGLIDTPCETPVDVDGVKVRYFPLAAPKRIYHSPAMGRAIENEIASFDVAHINGMFLWPGPKVAVAAAKAGVPVVISPRGMLVPEMIAGRSTLVKHLWIRLMERRGLALAGAIHVTSGEEAQGVRRLGLDLASLAVIGNGVDLPDHPPAEATVARIWAGIPQGKRVAFLGRLDWTKGVDLAIAAVREIADAQILIAGHDQIGLRAKLEPELAREGGALAGRFIGPVDGEDKWALLAGADVLVAPSVKESFGMSVAEALAIGTPVICTDGVGAATIVAQIDAGCVVPRTHEALTAALAAVLSDGPRRAAFAARAAACMAAEYTWDAIARRMEALYRDIGAKGARMGHAA